MMTRGRTGGWGTMMEVVAVLDWLSGRSKME